MSAKRSQDRPGGKLLAPARSLGSSASAGGSGRVRVTSGHPTDDELAAVVAAIARHRQAAAAAAAQHRGQRTSLWIRAARLEASGHPPIDSPMRLPGR